ncbi:RING finger and SPRY domain-containing protein 1 isoform X1 [Lingula anatina]|uniref:RING finger and SPRY domain-containing protein 1 isoform X1 n=1 Tax=Lingula anatina TaxID=7574 RepID=A0A1S3HBA1_LINAN|nr:RING finger and SPRY domain-containing protein 1 isoform X1 [Lingula anatina]|eukprot:XP_013382424.1 RING finger and SPRY domain-containing protein 1 isoform X1 [Lingula anatina]
MIILVWLSVITLQSSSFQRLLSRIYTSTMGACLCKDTPRGSQGHPGEISDSVDNPSRRQVPLGHIVTEPLNHLDIIESLILNTMYNIKTLVDNDRALPHSLLAIHKIADTESGWLLVVSSLVKVIPLEDPLGPATITLLLDECPLPSKGTIAKITSNLKIGKKTALDERKSKNIQRQRNTCIVLGCLAEKMAGPNSTCLMTGNVLDYLFTNLESDCDPIVILHSIVALEKFAQTSENKSTISQALDQMVPNPLETLEAWGGVNGQLDTRREVTFCAQWTLDNLFVPTGRNFTYKSMDHSGKNVILNCNDVSENLKIAPSGLEARCDASSFESVRCTFQANTGVWYYEVMVITPGVMQIGWATKNSKFLNYEGNGIGDDEYSLAYDGCRQLIWYNAKCEHHSHPCWKPGDILGLLLDLDKQEIIFSLNGNCLPAYNQVFAHARSGFFAAASFMSFQQCEFNFGMKPFRYPPKVAFKKFNDYGSLTDEEKLILPRHMRLALLRQVTVKEDSCTICFDKQDTVMLLPCDHTGFCMDCAMQLEVCPLCRTNIEQRKQVVVRTNSVKILNKDDGVHGTESEETKPGMKSAKTEDEKIQICMTDVESSTDAHSALEATSTHTESS